MPRPPNPRRTTLGPVSINRNTGGGFGGTERGTPSKPSVNAGPNGGGPNNVTTKQRASRKSMLPRMGRETNTTTTTATASHAPSTTTNATHAHPSSLGQVPPSPSNSIVSFHSTAAGRNSRRSLGGHQASNFNNHRPPMSGRPSMGGLQSHNNHSNANSIPSINNNNNINNNSNNTHASTLVKLDPRPIQDKAYQQHCMRILLTFLTKSGYEYPINLKTLSQPSGKDFNHIVTFLLKQMDSTFGNTNNTPSTELKMEEEIALYFKTLGYPYPVSKTALVAAGSPHTWPSLLAALAWLVEHILVVNIGMEEDNQATAAANAASGPTQFESLAELEYKTDRAFFQYLHRAYAAFLEGDTEQSDVYVGNLIDRFEEDNLVLEREVERVTELNATLAETIHLLDRQNETLPALTKKREQYATDLEQFHDLIRQMEEHCSALTLKVQDRSKELLQTRKELDSITVKMERLQQDIDTQPLSVEQVQKMHAEQARLKEAMEKALAFQQFNRYGLDRSQEELNTLWEDLELVVREYNEEASTLARNWAEFSQQPYKMTLDKSNITHDATQMLGIDRAGQLVPHLEQCQARTVKLLADTRLELKQMLDQLQASQTSWTEVTDRDKIVQMKLGKLQETYNDEHQVQESTLRVRLTQVENTQQATESLRDPASLEEQMGALSLQCDRLERLKEQHLQDTLARKTALQQELLEALVAIQEHSEFISKQFADLELYAEQQRNGLRRLSSMSL